jgi:hypothetical protein
MANIVFTGRRVRVSKKTGKVLGPAATQGVRRSVRTRVVGGLSLFQRNQVQRLVANQAEMKYVTEGLRVPNGITNLATWGGFSSAITGVGEIYAALPRTYQGLDDHQRIGNKISPKYVKIKLDITSTTWDDNSSRDRTVHVFLLTATSVKSLDNHTAIPITQLLNKGDGTNVSFDGTAYTAQYPVNTSEFRVLKHVRKRMVKGFGQPNGTTSSTAGGTDSVISPSGQYAHITLNVKIPKTFKFDRATQHYPTNYAPFLCIGFTDNKARDGAPLDYINVLGQVQMGYKDA